MKNIIILIVVLITSIAAQHKLPFASKDNAIELLLSNTSEQSETDVVVTVTDAPEWLKFTEKEQKFSKLLSNGDVTARFSFTVDKTAPINQKTKIMLTVTNANKIQLTKTISIQVSPPERFEVFQNYPNPFNPKTIIAYLIPSDNMVTVKIYNVLGKEIATLVNNEPQEPGYHEYAWNASNYASGMYIYQVLTLAPSGEKKMVQKKMLLVK